MRRSLAAILVLAALAASSVVAGSSTVSAQQGIQVISEEPTNEFPTGVSFSITVNAPAGVEEARLHYQLAPDGTGASAIARCNGGAAETCTYLLQSGRGIFIIPGAEITYHWEITDTDGNRETTPERLYVHEDTRFDFQTISSDNVTLYYHSGSSSSAQDVLDAAVQALQDVGSLEQTQVGFPIKVFLYRTADEMQPAIASAGNGAGVVILGEVVYSDTAMVSADVATLDITRHEVAHIVTREATRGPFGVPAWMNEGISVFAQEQPLSSHQGALDQAIAADRVLTMAEMKSSSPGARGDTVGLYYGEAGSIVRYLVDTYGEEKFAELLRVFKDGSTPDKAFEAVYGFDEDGLENGWRESVGLEPRTQPESRPTEPVRVDATPAPGEQPGSPTAGPDSGRSVVAMGIIGVLSIAVLGAVGIAAAVVRQRM